MLERLFMGDKTYIPEGEQAPASQIGATLEALAGTIHARREAGEGSYTFRLLTGNADSPLKKVVEEANEVALAAKDVEAAKMMLAGLAGHEGSHAGMAAAFAATAAAEAADGPGTRRLGNLDSPARAAPHAQAAQDAGGLVDLHMTF